MGQRHGRISVRVRPQRHALHALQRQRLRADRFRAGRGHRHMTTMAKALDHVYIASTILFTVYSQLVMRWQVGLVGPLPPDVPGKIGFVVHLLLNPWVLSGVAATFLAGVSWMMTMTKFQLSYAFP